MRIYFVTRSMVDECFYDADGELCSCRRRASCGCGPSSASSTSSPARSPSSARREAPRRALGGPRAAICARTMAAPSLAGARADRRQLHGEPARFRRPWPPTRTATRPRTCTSSGAASLWVTELATRRSMSSPGTATTRPTSTICAATRRGAGPLRPCRPVDLHRADLAVGDAGPPTSTSSCSATAGWWPRTPSAALVPHERDERVHGAGLRPVRRASRASSRAAARCTT